MRRAVIPSLCVIAALHISACADDSHEYQASIFADSKGTTGDDSADSSDSEGSGGPDEEHDSGDADDSGQPGDSGAEPDAGSIKFDLGAVPSDDEETPCGVDILFVIDNSGSMNQHKDDIVDAFDSFIAEMIGALPPLTPVHVGVTRATGFYKPGNGSGWNDPTCQFGYLDGVWAPPTEWNNGVNGQQGRLFEQDGERFFAYEVGDDPGALGQWFETTLAKAIMLDQSSNTESVVAAAAYPFHPVNAEHNAGFLRDKAVLVLFLLSDAPDATPPSVPTDEFIDMVSAAKAGCGDGCVLPTGVVQSACYDQPGNLNTRLPDFMGAFGAPPAALEFFYMNEPPASFTSVLGATLAETIAFTCEYIVPVE